MLTSLWRDLMEKIQILVRKEQRFRSTEKIYSYIVQIFSLSSFSSFPFWFSSISSFFLTVESQDKVGHNWEEQLLGWISGFGAHLTMFLCIIVAAVVGLLSRLLMTSKFPTCLPSILYEADSALEPVLGVCTLHHLAELLSAQDDHFTRVSDQHCRRDLTRL